MKNSTERNAKSFYFPLVLYLLVIDIIISTINDLNNFRNGENDRINRDLSIVCGIFALLAISQIFENDNFLQLD